MDSQMSEMQSTHMNGQLTIRERIIHSSFERVAEDERIIHERHITSIEENLIKLAMRIV